MIAIYQGGMAVNAGVSISWSTDRIIKSSLFAWDDLFWWPAPSLKEVYGQAILSAITNPCGECSKH